MKHTPNEITRSQQTKRIILAIAFAAVGLALWNEYNRDYSAMDPMTRCEYWMYREQNGILGGETGCKASVAAARLRGY